MYGSGGNGNGVASGGGLGAVVEAGDGIEFGIEARTAIEENGSGCADGNGEVEERCPAVGTPTAAQLGHALSPLALPTAAILNRQTILTVPPLEPIASQSGGDLISVITSTTAAHAERQ